MNISTKLKNRKYVDWIQRLEIPVENFGEPDRPIYAIRFDQIEAAFDRICGNDSILSDCMSETFSKKFGVQTGIVGELDGTMGIFESDVQRALCAMFGNK